MPRLPKQKFIDHFRDDGSLETLISFTFSFTNTGSYAAWEVWSNGRERSNHASSGSFSGTISQGSILRVECKIWDGSYNITYECKSGSVKKDDSSKPSPRTGQAMGPKAKTEVINIQF